MIEIIEKTQISADDFDPKGLPAHWRVSLLVDGVWQVDWNVPLEIGSDDKKLKEYLERKLPEIKKHGKDNVSLNLKSRFLELWKKRITGTDYARG